MATPDEGTRPVTKHVSIPREDESVIRWFNAQQNASFSLRLVIREYIQRHGYTDPSCSPVEQLPARGRPRNDDDDVPATGSFSRTSSKSETFIVTDDSAQQEDTTPVPPPPSVPKNDAHDINNLLGIEE